MKRIYPLLLLLILPIILITPTSSYAAKHLIDVKDFEFDPVHVPDVQIGDTIRWEWVNGFHTTTSGSIPEGAVSWDSNITSSVTSFEYVVAVPGTYNYVCTPHVPGMVASFTVLPAQTLAVDPNNIDVTYTAGTTSFTVQSNTSWTVESDAAWSTATSAGSGNGTIDVNYNENTTSDIRVANLTVTTTSSLTVLVTVTQAAANVSVEEIVIPALQVYPNPSNGIVTLEMQWFLGKQVQISVLNLEGQIILQKELIATAVSSLDISELPAGTYIVKMNAGAEQFSKQLILTDK
ncbi:MAG: T9SS type A sorting domain-containing protein [Bacteroidales bacterium]|nr:T9SS type A sorting domain-containing protein [Bacteroidales bacterium]